MSQQQQSPPLDNNDGDIAAGGGRQNNKRNGMGRDHFLGMVAAVACCLLALLWSAGFDVTFWLTLCLVGCAGYALGFALLGNEHFCFGLQIVVGQFFGLIPQNDEEGGTPFTPKKNKIGVDFDEAKFLKGSAKATAPNNRNQNANYIAPPWEQLKLDSRLNQELEELFETLVEYYVNNWYTEAISTDTSFVLEIRHLIRHSSAKLINRLSGVDMHALFMEELFPLVLAHVERISRLVNNIFRAENGGPLEIAHAPPSFVEFKVLEQWGDDLHWAMRSAPNYHAYLRSVADLLVRHLVDDIRIGGCFVDEEHMKIMMGSGGGGAVGGGGGAAIPSATNKWSCHGSRHFLRELLLSTVLIPSIDFVADPDSLNRLALNILNDAGASPSMIISSPAEGDQITAADDESESPHDLPSPGEEFLAKFVESNYAHTPDSLLGLKLNDLVENPYLTKLFEMYLRDLNGPTHLLDCFVQARDIHMRIQADSSNKSLQLQQEHGEICFDAWQLFSTFVHSNAPNRIHFGEGIADEFSSVLESEKKCGEAKESADEGRKISLKSLERVIEHVYQQVYHKLQYNYMIPFCQSENYLGYLCGAPPDVDELIRGPVDDQWTRRDRQKLPEGTFSLAQFRKKLFNFITATKEAPPPTTFHSNSMSTPASMDEHGTTSVVDSMVGGGALAAGGAANFESANFAMIDLSRDITKWSVAIEGVEQRRTANQTYHLFSLLVERNDLPEECYAPSTAAGERAHSVDDYEDEFDERMPRIWTVGHRYEEFYALEDRLRAEHGGTLRLSALPDRKTMLQLLQAGRNNNRTLMESHRVHFERFLQQLLQQPNMRRSDLLYAFLTSEENSTGLFELASSEGGGGVGNFLPDLNPLRAMRKVGGKERGQNLKPFILNLLANTLAPPIRSQQQKFVPFQRQNSNSLSAMGENGREGSVRSEAIGSRSDIGSKKQFSSPASVLPDKIPTELDLDDDECKQTDTNIGPEGIGGWKNDFYDLFLFLTVHMGALTRLSAWIESLLCSLRSFVGFLFSLFVRQRVHRVLDEHLLNVDMAVYLVRSLHELILFWNVPTSCCSLSATPSQISVASSSVPQQQSQYAKMGEERRRQLHRKHEKAVRKLSSSGIGSFPVSEQERHLRAELVLHCLEKRAECLLLPGYFSPFLQWIFGRIAAATDQKRASEVEMDTPDAAEGVGDEQQKQSTSSFPPSPALDSPVRLLFLCFQMPALNRQLSLVLLDKLLQRIIMEQPSSLMKNSLENDGQLNASSSPY